MGCLFSPEATQAQSQKFKREVNLFLHGIAGSGKSTFVKQMLIIHNGGFQVEQAMQYKTILLSNIIVALKAIIELTPDLNGPNKKKGRWIQNIDPQVAKWDDDEVERVKSLWNDEAVKEAWEEVKEITLIQLDYLMENIDRFVTVNFQPTNEDILRARHRTTGESSTRIIDKKICWNFIDVGGQAVEREKWKNIIETKLIHAFIFFVALDDFNVANPELKTSEHVTKLELALAVFEEVMNSVGNVCRIVFLNKVDLFQKKIEDKEKFAEFKKALNYDGENNVDDCTKFLEKKLTGMLQNKDSFHVHVTNALDTDMMRKVADDIKEAILSAHLSSFGVM